MIDPRNATLVERTDLDDMTTVFRVRPDTPLYFVAGQWTEMGLPKVEGDEEGPRGEEFVKDGVVRRAYSICSVPDNPELEFIFNRVDEGQLTKWLWKLQPGDRLYIDPEARGHFTLDGVSDSKNLIFAATGTGIAPFASLARTFAGKNRWKRLILIHGARHAGQLGFAGEFHRVEELDGNVLYLPVLSRPNPEDNWQGLTGHLTQLFLQPERFAQETKVSLNPSATHVYLCGNSDMIREVEDYLMPLGFEPRWSDPNGTIHTEIYY